MGGAMKIRMIVATVATLMLGGCATLAPEVQARFDNRVIEAAELTPGAQLKTMADTGDGHAQYSYSLVLRYGLQADTPVDVPAADVYRARAMASRGSQTTAIYVPGTKKTAGHTMLVDMPQYDVLPLEARTVEACLALLTATSAPADIGGVCGGPDNFQRLKAQWHGTVPPTAPAH